MGERILSRSGSAQVDWTPSDRHGDAPKVFVVGDLNVDYLISGDRLQSGMLLGRSEAVAGGNGLNAACAFRRAGFTSIMIGRVGNDAHGRLLLVTLANAGVEVMVEVDERRPTGTCHIVYARENKYESKLKLMNQDHANFYDPVAVEKAFQSKGIGPNDLLFMPTDILARQGVETFRQIVRSIGQYGPRLVLDVVPHDIYHKLRACDLVDALKGQAHVLIAELITLINLVQTGPVRQAPTEEDWRLLFRHFGPDILVLRYGFDNITLQAVRRKIPGTLGSTVLLPETDTGYRAVASPGEKRGYGDKLTAGLIGEILAIL